jgi:sialic acid synthase SpsE
MAKMMVWSSDLDEGHRLTDDDISFKSPMDGLSPQHFKDILGRKLINKVKEDSPVSLSDLE